MHYLGYSYTSFEALFKLYSDHIHKRYMILYNWKLCSFLQKRFTWPLEARVTLKELLFFPELFRMAKSQMSFSSGTYL